MLSFSLLSFMLAACRLISTYHFQSDSTVVWTWSTLYEWKKVLYLNAQRRFCIMLRWRNMFTLFGYWSKNIGIIIVDRFILFDNLFDMPTGVVCAHCIDSLDKQVCELILQASSYCDPSTISLLVMRYHCFLVLVLIIGRIIVVLTRKQLAYYKLLD